MCLYAFRDKVRCRAGPDDCLCAMYLCCMYMYLFDICYMHVGRGPIYHRAQLDDRVGLDDWAGPIICFAMCGMRYLGELTKLGAYGFHFMFKVLRFSKSKSSS